MGIVVNPRLSPREILIESPATSISVQELYDGLRDWEDSEEGMYFPFIISAGGKETLSATEKVNVTATLQNAVILFEDRPGPTYEIMEINGGNLVAIDENDIFINPIKSTAFTQVIRTLASGSTILSPDITVLSEVADSVWQRVIEGTMTSEEVFKVLLAVAAGQSTITDLGNGAATVKFRDQADTKDRVTATMDESERTAVVVDGT